MVCAQPTNSKFGLVGGDTVEIIAKVIKWIIEKLANKKQPDTSNIVVVKVNFVIHKD